MTGSAEWIRTENLSKWYGEVLGVQEVSLEVGPGITALVGPNGSGKSTLFRLLMGQLRPSQGTARLFGRDPWSDRSALSRVGFAPEGERVPERIGARTWVEGLSRLSGLDAHRARGATEEALAAVRLSPADWDRPLGTYSNGMRQKAKLAQAIVHAPDLLVLDEPFTGVDPASRQDLADTLKRLAAAGKGLLLSGHNLSEMARLTDRIALLYRGRLIAAGRVSEIRAWISRYPHRIRIVCDDPRTLASRLSRRSEVVGLRLSEPGVLVAETFDGERLLADLTGLLAESGVSVEAFYPEDERLESVFAYLTKGAP